MVVDGGLAGASGGLWEHAGPTGSAEGLERLLAAPSPLVRLIARGALVCAESRGVHFRVDHPAADDAFAGHIVARSGEHPLLERWS